MKIAINSCFGGFSLSALAVKTIAERQGKKCFFFKTDLKNGERYIPVENPDSMFWVAFSIDNPNEVLASKKSWHEMTIEERRKHNALYDSISLESHYDANLRIDPLLISVIEELGEQANGKCADLKIVEIPDGIEWEIDEYDGLEHIAEKHRTWR